ncbi:helix-turn-helix transcriptional regulator [Chitinibacter tainanensis]|uniref:helix-turn-helix transcriptional regulator n=1 Tax=Chitinibacter tainanensis TaxID=230667 RepID=UPI000A0747C3|nr:helix-turn-helix domain-containing protein [Chitinibacter tainanensis]
MLRPVAAHGVHALLTKASLCEQLKISERTLENMVRQGVFPPPVRIGKYVYWSETAVVKWQELRFAAQNAWTEKLERW